MATERIPSCDIGLVEDFKQNKCVARLACGALGQRPCLLTERIPSCNSGLLEDFVHNRCVPAKDLVGAVAVESCKAALKAHRVIAEMQNTIQAQQAAVLAQLRKDQRLVDTILQAAERVQREREQLTEELDAAARTFISPAHVERFRELLDPERLCGTPPAETWEGLRAILMRDPSAAKLLQRGSFLIIGNQFAGAKGVGVEFGYGLAIVLPDAAAAGKSPPRPRYWIYLFAGGMGTPGAGGSVVAQVGVFQGTPSPAASYMALGWSRPFGKDTSGEPKGDVRFLPVMDLFFDFPVQGGRWVAGSVEWFQAHTQGAVVSVGAAFSSKSYTRAGGILGDWALQGGYAWSFPLDR